MLKRYQVLLPDWLEDYIKHGVERFGFSFSEIIRMQMCFTILSFIEDLNPEYSPKVKTKDILSIINKRAKNEAEKKELKKFVSLVYYETRKAIEYRTKWVAEKE